MLTLKSIVKIYTNSYTRFYYYCDTNFSHSASVYSTFRTQYKVIYIAQGSLLDSFVAFLVFIDFMKYPQISIDHTRIDIKWEQICQKKNLCFNNINKTNRKKRNKKNSKPTISNCMKVIFSIHNFSHNIIFIITSIFCIRIGIGIKLNYILY